MAEMTYRYNPKPDAPLLKEGVTTGWQVLWSGEPGPAKCRKVQALVDEAGSVVLVPVEDWQDVTVTAD